MFAAFIAAVPSLFVLGLILFLTRRHDRRVERERNMPTDMDDTESFYHKK